MKKQSGITLVSLVITIIVLIIIAGVSIAMLITDKGLLTNSKQTQTVTMEKSNQEIVNLAIQDLLAKYEAGGEIAANITNTNNSPATLEINKEELKAAIDRTTADADITDITDVMLNIAEDDLEEPVAVIKVDFAQGQDIYVEPSTGNIVTEQL